MTMQQLPVLQVSLSDDDIERVAHAVARLVCPPSDVMSVRETAERLRISERTVHRHLSTRRLDPVRVGGRTLVTRESVERLVRP